MICWKCKKEIFDENIARLAECPFCSCDLRCCKGCKFYSEESRWNCKENIDFFVQDKERANFCDFFSANKFLKSGDKNKTGGKSASDRAKDLFYGLFDNKIINNV